jgi:hypothetical protein
LEAIFRMHFLDSSIGITFFYEYGYICAIALHF